MGHWRAQRSQYHFHCTCHCYIIQDSITPPSSITFLLHRSKGFFSLCTWGTGVASWWYVFLLITSRWPSHPMSCPFHAFPHLWYCFPQSLIGCLYDTNTVADEEAAAQRYYQLWRRTGDHMMKESLTLSWIQVVSKLFLRLFLSNQWIILHKLIWTFLRMGHILKTYELIYLTQNYILA